MTEKEIVAKKHLTADRRLMLAVCDKNILGRKFTEDGKLLDVSIEFYGGSIVAEEEIKLLATKAFSINAAGVEAVKICCEAKGMDPSDAPTIEKVPYLQLMMF